MSAGSPLRVVDVLAAELRRLGVTHLFGVGGANIEDLYDAVRRTPGGARPVVAKHEFSAATMADGYARTTGRLGVVAATSGGGAMNLVPGLAEAYASRIPVLALVGQPPLAGEGRGVFQDSSGKAGALDAGLKVARNRPYAGGFCTRSYGRPQHGVHAIQVEISRHLYMNEVTLNRNDNFNAVRQLVEQLIFALLGFDFAALGRPVPGAEGEKAAAE